MEIKKGDIIVVDLEPVKGCETGKTRTCLVIQNDIGNKYSFTTIIAVITAYNEKKAKIAICVPVNKGEGKLNKKSIIDCGQIRTIDKVRIVDKLGSLQPETMKKVNNAIKISLALVN